jgi:hypothetical protein
MAESNPPMNSVEKKRASRRPSGGSSFSRGEDQAASSIDEGPYPHQTASASATGSSTHHLLQHPHSDDEFHSCRDESNQSFSLTELSNLSGLSSTYPETYSRGAELQRGAEHETARYRQVGDQREIEHSDQTPKPAEGDRSLSASRTDDEVEVKARGKSRHTPVPHAAAGTSAYGRGSSLDALEGRAASRAGVGEREGSYGAAADFSQHATSYPYRSPPHQSTFPVMSSPNASLTAPVAFGLSFDDILQQLQFALEDSQFQVESLRLELHHQRKLNERNAGIIAMLRAGSPSSNHHIIGRHYGRHEQQQEVRVQSHKKKDVVEGERVLVAPESSDPVQTPQIEASPQQPTPKPAESVVSEKLDDESHTTANRSEPGEIVRVDQLQEKLQRAEAELNELRVRCAQLEQQLLLLSAQSTPPTVRPIESREMQTNTETIPRSPETEGVQSPEQGHPSTNETTAGDESSQNGRGSWVEQSAQTEQLDHLHSIGTETDPLPEPPAVRSIGLQPTLPLAATEAVQTDPAPVTVLVDLQTATDVSLLLDGETQTEDQNAKAEKREVWEYQMGSGRSPWGRLWMQVAESLRPNVVQQKGDEAGLSSTGENSGGSTLTAPEPTPPAEASREEPPFRLVSMSNLHPLPLEDHATAVREGLRLLQLSAAQVDEAQCHQEEEASPDGGDETPVAEDRLLLEGATDLLDATRTVIKLLQRELRCTRTVLHECARERAGFEALASNLEKERRRLMEEVKSGASRSLQMRRDARSLSPMERSTNYCAPPNNSGTGGVPYRRSTAHFATSPSSRSPSAQSQRSTSSSTNHRPSGRPAPAAKVSPLKRMPRAGPTAHLQEARSQTAAFHLATPQEKSAGGEELQSVSSATYTNDSTSAPAQRRATGTGTLTRHPHAGSNAVVTPSRNSSPSLRPSIPRLALDRVHSKSPSEQRPHGAAQPKDGRGVSPKGSGVRSANSQKPDPAVTPSPSSMESRRGPTAAPAPSLLGPALTVPKERTTNGQVGFRAPPRK